MSLLPMPESGDDGKNLNSETRIPYFLLTIVKANPEKPTSVKVGSKI